MMEQKDTDGLVSIKYVVASYLNQAEIDESVSGYERLVQITVEGITHLKMFHMKSTPAQQEISINDAGLVDLPYDCMEVIDVGYNNNGTFYPMVEEENMLEMTSLSCGEDIRGNGQTVVTNGDSIYVKGGGYDVFSYKVNTKQRTIAISGTVPGNKIIVKYLSSGISLDSETLVPLKALQALKAYIYYNSIKYDRNVGVGEKALAQRNYQTEVTNLRAFDFAFDIKKYKDKMARIRYNGIKY